MNEIKITKTEIICQKIKDFFTNWIYPAYHLKNLLFHRYDLIKVPQIKPWEYAEPADTMRFAIFELIKDFIENRNPEKYILWYKDESGLDAGHKYGESEFISILYPERKGEWIMDLIKEVYNFYTKEMPRIKKEIDYIIEVNHKYITNFDFKECENQENVPEDEKLYKLINIEKKRNLNEPEIKNLNWNVLMKYFENKEDVLDEIKIIKGYHKAEADLENKIRYYMHLAVEVSPYLWT